MPLPKPLLIIFFCAALVGFADAAFLTAQYLQGVIPPCGTSGCEEVLTSTYARLGPIPLPVLGMLYYGSVLVLLIAFFDTGGRWLIHAASWLASAGFLASLFFVYLQLFVIKAICPYCMLSATMSLLMFLVSVRIMRID